MSIEESRRVSLEDIQLVQNLIEQCLQLYMSQKEATNILLEKARIEPAFTELVWQKLEEENPDFFKEYHLRLVLKEQILLFNQLLEKQAKFMNQPSNGPTAIDMSNGSHNPLMSQNSACYAQEYVGSTLKAGDMHQPLNSSIYSNGGSSSVYMQGTVDISDDDKRKKSSSNMLMTSGSNMGYMQGTVDIFDDDKRKKSSSNMLMTNGFNMGYVQGTIDISNDDKGKKSPSNMLMTNGSNMGYVQGTVDSSNMGYVQGAVDSSNMGYVQGAVDISNDDKRKKASSNMLMTNGSNMGYVQGTVDISNGDKRNKSSSNMLMTNSSNMGYVQRTVDISNGDKRNTSSSNMLMTNNSNMGYVQGMNRRMMNLDIGYINGSPCMFGPNVNVLDARYAAVERPVSSYSSVKPHSQPINNNTLFGADATYESLGKIPKTVSSYSSVEPHSQPINNSIHIGSDATYESLGKIPKNFSLSDLTADFCLSSDILESFSGSPFLATGSDSFLDPQLQVQQQDNRSLDTTVEGLTYHNFKRD